MGIYEVLKTYFGYDNFKKGQEKLVSAILAGRDVLGIMPQVEVNLFAINCLQLF